MWVEDEVEILSVPVGYAVMLGVCTEGTITLVKSNVLDWVVVVKDWLGVLETELVLGVALVLVVNSEVGVD